MCLSMVLLVVVVVIVVVVVCIIMRVVGKDDDIVFLLLVIVVIHLSREHFRTFFELFLHQLVGEKRKASLWHEFQR